LKAQLKCSAPRQQFVNQQRSGGNSLGGALLIVLRPKMLEGQPQRTDRPSLAAASRFAVADDRQMAMDDFNQL
jgi:hypothetical protein